MAGISSVLRIWTSCDIGKLNTQEGGKRVVVAGLITEYREIISKKGSRMAFVRVEDLSGSVELVVFPEPFAKHEMQLKSDQPVLVGGKLEKDGDAVKIMVDRVGILSDVLKKSKQMIFKIDGSMMERLAGLNTLLQKHPGMTGVELEIDLPDLKKTVTMAVTEPTGIDPSGDFFEGLHGLFGRTDFVEVRS